MKSNNTTVEGKSWDSINKHPENSWTLDSNAENQDKSRQTWSLTVHAL